MTNKEAILKRVSTGIIGLDAIMDGGIREGTVLMVAGASGTGKSTFASQFLLHGLENGESALYITLEEKPEQLIKEARLMGWDIEEYYANGQLSFFHTSGRDFGEIIEKELSASLQKRDKTKKTRIAIDPLTPLLWATREDIIRRELLTKLFEMLKEVGPVVVTVEEHTTPGEIFGKEILVPIYLSDAAIHLKYQPLGGAFNRTLEIMKMRGSRHGEEVYPYFFVHGIGMIVRSAPITITPKKEYLTQIETAIEIAKDAGAPSVVIDKLNSIKKTWHHDFSPKEALEKIFEFYGLKNYERNKSRF